MNNLRSVVAGIILLLAFPGISSAQILPWHWFQDQEIEWKEFCSVDPVTTACQKEFDEWQKLEKKWRGIKEVWGNYVDYHGLKTPNVGKGGKRSPVPVWIPIYCLGEIEQNIEPKSVICEAYADYLTYDWTAHILGPGASVTYSTTVTVVKKDANGFIEFLLKNAHVDGPWTNSSNGPRVWGYFGSHLTLAKMGKIGIWGPPGCMFFKTPDNKVHFQMTYGLDFFVGEIPVGKNFKLPVYFTMAKVFNKAQGEAIKRNVNSGMDMMGLSITLKK